VSAKSPAPVSAKSPAHVSAESPAPVSTNALQQDEEPCAKRRKTVTPDAMPATDAHLVQTNQLISEVTRFIEATRERLQGPQDGLVLRDAYLDVTREIRELAYLHQVTTDSLRTSPPMIHQCMQEEICLSKLMQFSIELSSRIGSCVPAQPICA